MSIKDLHAYKRAVTQTMALPAKIKEFALPLNANYNPRRVTLDFILREARKDMNLTHSEFVEVVLEADDVMVKD